MSRIQSISALYVPGWQHLCRGETSNSDVVRRNVFKLDSVIERQPKPLREMLRSPVAARLVEDGETIRRLRDELGYAEPFSPFERYLHYRQMRSANSPDEPKLAAQLLAELGMAQT